MVSRKRSIVDDIEEMCELNTGENKTWTVNPYPKNDNKKLRNMTIKQLEEVKDWMIGRMLEQESNCGWETTNRVFF